MNIHAFRQLHWTQRRTSRKEMLREHLRHQDGKCAYCLRQVWRSVRRAEAAGHGDRAATLDHKLPISRGGKHTLKNTCAACRWCNTRKGDMSPSAFMSWLALNPPPYSPLHVAPPAKRAAECS